MRYKHFILLLLAGLILSCKKPGSTFSILDGTYTGTFQRQTITSGHISNVTVTFSGNNWSGESQSAKYPALCNGTFEVNGTNDINFENACIWTAEFDWTLILSGNYNIRIAGNDIEITRDYNGSVKDIYKLIKQ
jgi:hypothetical protein